MSPRKLTEDNKQEILNLYRNSEATTSTLASNYEVSSSTISRFLKNKLSSSEYEDLIQQKRLARTPRGEKTADITEESIKEVGKTTKNKTKSSPNKAEITKIAKTKRTRKKKESTVLEEKLPDTTSEMPVQLEIETSLATKSEPQAIRRRRRRSSSASKEIPPIMASEETSSPETTGLSEENEAAEVIENKQQASKLVIDKQPSGNSQKIISNEEESDLSKSSSLILKTYRVDLEDEEDDTEPDLVVIKEMLGDDLEDFNDDEDEDDWDDWDEDEDDFSTQSSALHDLEILPLSQAAMPRTCYLVIDRSAELIVKPLADFADLGDIPQEEIKQRTLPVFDNHRIAKRFSHRRERVIKVPDGRMIQKTSHHLENKGITRLLFDGQIYSLAH